MKKLLIILTAIALVFTLASCKEEDPHTLVFNTNGGTPVAAKYVNDGVKISNLVGAAKTTKEDWAFRGWYTDKDCTKLWDGGRVYSDMVLYAGWDQAFVTFESETEFTIKPEAAANWTKMEYSLDGYTWTDITRGSATTSAKKVYFRGSGNSVVTDIKINNVGTPSDLEKYTWKITGTNVKCSGNILTLLDHENVYKGETVTFNERAFAYMFKDQTALVSAPDLSSISSLKERCFESTFEGCTGLSVSQNSSHGGVKFYSLAYPEADYCKDMFKDLTLDTGVLETPNKSDTPYYIY